MKTPSLGIDIAQHSFVAALWVEQRSLGKVQFENHSGGFRKLRDGCRATGSGL